MTGSHEVSGSIPLISTKKVLKSLDFRTFSFVLTGWNGGLPQPPARFKGVPLPCCLKMKTRVETSSGGGFSPYPAVVGLIDCFMEGIIALSVRICWSGLDQKSA